MPIRSTSLADPPDLRLMGIALHGQEPMQRFTNLTFWSVHAYRYRATLIAGDQRIEIEPGTVTVLMPGEDLEYHYHGPSQHTFAHFLPSRSTRELRPFRIIYRLGEAFERFDADFREAVGWFAHERLRARARVWDLLWRLAEPAAEAAGVASMPPVLSRAMELIELSMTDGVSVTSLADQVDLSPAHLTRLFRHHLSVSPLQYVLQRRVSRAEHLLKHTTLPVKAIAKEVGIRDLQQFNKLLRHRTGKSPRGLRAT